MIRCTFGVDCPPPPLTGSATVRLDAFTAGHGGGALNTNPYRLTASIGGTPAGNLACGSPAQWSGDVNATVIAGPCISSVRVDGFSVTPPANTPASAWTHTVAYAGQNLLNNPFTGSLNFTAPTKPGEPYAWGWSGATAHATWTTYGWNPVNGVCPNDATRQCLIGWQRAQVTVSGTVPTSVTVRPAQTFTVLGANAVPGD